MKKKILFILTVLLILLSINDCIAEVLEIGDYKLNVLDNETAEVIKYLGTEAYVSVPSKIQGFNIISIKDMTFQSYDKLVSVVIPDSIASIGNMAFFKCKNLESIYVSPDNNYYASIDGVLFSKENKSLVFFPQGKQISEYSVPDGIESIESNAFYECSNLFFQGLRIHGSGLRIFLHPVICHCIIVKIKHHELSFLPF